MKKIAYILIVLLSFIEARASLQAEIERLCGGIEAEVGVCVAVGEEKVCVGPARQYPLMSLFKFPVAVAALDHHARVCGEDVSACLHRVRADEILPDTYSPLREKVGQNDVTLSFDELVRYAVALSDNNVCDWLIRYAGGIDAVAAFWRTTGNLRDFALTETEETMHADLARCENNRATPESMTDAFARVFDGKGILSPANRDFLRTVMEDSPTGTDKLKAGLPAAVAFAHKTGHSDRLPDGRLIATTDAGRFALPDGRICRIAVLIHHSRAPDAQNARLMADIMCAVWRHYTSGENEVIMEQEGRASQPNP